LDVSIPYRDDKNKPLVFGFFLAFSVSIPYRDDKNKKRKKKKRLKRKKVSIPYRDDKNQRIIHNEEQ